MGLPGCIGPTDATLATWNMGSNILTNVLISDKEKGLPWQVMVTHEEEAVFVQFNQC
jgi:hypothetical protein